MQSKVYPIRVLSEMIENKDNKLTSNETIEDKKINLRPKRIEDFIGQETIKSNLNTFIKSLPPF